MSAAGQLIARLDAVEEVRTATSATIADRMRGVGVIVFILVFLIRIATGFGRVGTRELCVSFLQRVAQSISYE